MDPDNAYDDIVDKYFPFDDDDVANNPHDVHSDDPLGVEGMHPAGSSTFAHDLMFDDPAFLDELDMRIDAAAEDTLLFAGHDTGQHLHNPSHQALPLYPPMPGYDVGGVPMHGHTHGHGMQHMLPLSASVPNGMPTLDHRWENIVFRVGGCY